MTVDPFTVWAPTPDRIEVEIRDPRSGGQPTVVPLEKGEDDWWRPAGEVPDPLTDGAFDYGFRLDGGDARPDPRSRFQPEGVHGLSRTFDPASHQWGDEMWTGQQLAGAVIYEMHVGTFTPDGTLDSAIEKLDHLKSLGIDFVEIMPVNAFNGEHNWGYDGVLWFAVHHTYGGPAAYQRFVDACHQRGLGVIQDAVYNHLGPSGNYLNEYGPYLTTGSTNTWGDTLNLDAEDSDEVRRYIIDNAMMWMNDYHVDGLRLDAVHALVDNRAIHILEELATETEALSAFAKRPLSLIAESDLNDPRLITHREAGGYGLTAQWSDDFHHALYVSLTGDTTGYYADFESIEALAKVVESGFFHDGTKSSFRGRSQGRPIDTLHTPTWRLVVCSDNHDQIGNRAAGERLSAKIGFRQLSIAAVVTLLCPFTPMIFMGEEWGASTPWQFFTSHPEKELGEQVSEGRLEEFAKMDWDTSSVPDPQDPETFTRSKLHWSEPEGESHSELLELNRRLLELRSTYPDLTDPRFTHGAAQAEHDEGWLLIERGVVVIAVNFHAEATTLPIEGSFEMLLNVGDCDFADGTLRLDGHSAVVAERTDDVSLTDTSPIPVVRRT